MRLNFQGETIHLQKDSLITISWTIQLQAIILLQIQPTLQVTASACVSSERSSEVEDKASLKAAKFSLDAKLPSVSGFLPTVFLGFQFLAFLLVCFFFQIQRYGSLTCGDKTETTPF